jgi:hypothetical protein
VVTPDEQLRKQWLRTYARGHILVGSCYAVCVLVFIGCNSASTQATPLSWRPEEIRGRLQQLASIEDDEQLLDEYCEFLLALKVRPAVQHGNVISVGRGIMVVASDEVILQGKDDKRLVMPKTTFIAALDDEGTWRIIANSARQVAIYHRDHLVVVDVDTGIASHFPPEG